MYWEIGHARVSLFVSCTGERSNSNRWHHPPTCKAEASAARNTARRNGKPASYTWTLWHEPRPKPKPLATHPIPRAWVTQALQPAWQRICETVSTLP